MKKLLIALMFTLALTPLGYAHEGHDQKIMGTVAAIQDNHLEVKAADGKTSMIMLNDKTKVLQGKAAKKAADIKVGDRVVVTATDVKDKAGKTMLVAKQVNLGNASPTTAAKK